MALKWYIVHVYSGFENKVKAALTERIAALAGPGYERVALSSGGSEGIEIAIKFLRQ